ncbi:transporter [Pseudomonas sp. ZM23]|uniref:Transporter n=1 Tax=Pseudomonas triclosanedens TaxID=2961893 RepID=A0ABY6ZTA6_9PSED|nr:transporter [Pseudomonas triclosanedens]MCP8467113.1 transporter [Pseudomonas triclosanedens]MCP8472738.1 transporter [Pseudomonas triclosanedens]MCP8478169.1 transporter [Pseudomonas triclosanedens]WAI47576.1 transporter [Pseudomonas triclosanedens]
MNRFNPALRLSCALLLGGALPFAQATEGGGSSWPMGIENYLMGVVPPPGIYGQVFAADYRADSLRGNDGRELPVDFDLHVSSIVPRFIWVTEQQMLGGNLGFHAVVPLNRMRLKMEGQRESKSGLGDIHVGPFLGYHYSDKLHAATGIDVVLPTGSYDKHDLVNLGRNYTTLQAIYALSYIDPQGLNADVRLMYDYNFENQSTDYLSGQELHADYAVGWGLGNGWVVGVGGYIYRQVSDDEQDGHRIDDNRGRAFAIGPSVQYSAASGWHLSAKWQQESDVRNRPEGAAYWLKWTFPL